MRASNRRCLLLLAHLEPKLDKDDPAIDDVFLDDRAVLQETPILLLRAEAHHALHAGAVVPTAVEDHDFAGSRKVLHVTLQVHLRLFAVRRSRQRDESEDARAHAFGDRLDGPALAGRVAPLEDHDHPQSLELHPLLQAAEFGLELAQFLLVLFAFHLGFGRVHVYLFRKFVSWPAKCNQVAKRKGIYKGRRRGRTKGKPERAIALAAKGLRITEIATALGTSERTIHRYLRSGK